MSPPTEEGSPQGGNLSPLLAKSERASQRLLESSVSYLEGILQLKVNREKSRTVSVFVIRNFNFLGFCFGKGRNGVFIRVHLEAGETAKNAQKKTSWSWTARVGGLRRRLQSEGLLAYGEFRCGKKSINQRKIDTLGIFRFSHSIPVCARQLLKPPCTERYARWCERTAANHRLLLD